MRKPSYKYDELEIIVLNYCNIHNINILPQRFSTAVGRAWIETNHIKIPYIDSVEDFLVCLHEIGHIVTGKKIDADTPDYIFEYLADKWAIDTAKKHGIINKKYEMRAKWYVLSYIADYHNKNEGYTIPKRILKFVGEDIANWEGFNITVFYTAKELTITKKLREPVSKSKGFK